MSSRAPSLRPRIGCSRGHPSSRAYPSKTARRPSSNAPRTSSEARSRPAVSSASPGYTRHPTGTAAPCSSGHAGGPTRTSSSTSCTATPATQSSSLRRASGLTRNPRSSRQTYSTPPLARLPTSRPRRVSSSSGRTARREAPQRRRRLARWPRSGSRRRHRQAASGSVSSHRTTTTSCAWRWTPRATTRRRGRRHHSRSPKASRARPPSASGTCTRCRHRLLFPPHRQPQDAAQGTAARENGCQRSARPCLQELATLEHTTSKDEPTDSIAGVQAVCFSEDGRLVISVCRNTHHSLFVWEWRTRKLLYRENTCQGTPPCVFGIKWNPVEVGEGSKQTKLFDFCSFGTKHIIFWKECPPPKESKFKRIWSQDAGSFLNKDNPKGTKSNDGVDIQDVLCVEFLPDGGVVTGMQSGDMYMWQAFGATNLDASSSKSADKSEPGKKVRSGVDMRVIRRITVPSPEKGRPPSRAHTHNLTVLKLRAGGSAQGTLDLLSGGGDGEIKVWKVKAGQPVHYGTCRIPRVTKRSSKPLIKALDTFPASDEVVVGTDKCDIWKIELERSGKDLVLKEGKLAHKSRQLVVKGHADYLRGLDAHPTKDFLMASACKSDRVYIWNCKAKEEVAFASFPGEQAVACAFSSDGHRLAVGTVAGKVFILSDAAQTPEQEEGGWAGELFPLRASQTQAARMPIRDCVSEISELRYSPNNKMLAVASHDQMIDIYNAVGDSYVRLARCKGHSSTVLHVDWSTNSRVLQSTCSARELLYWDTWWGYDDDNLGAQPRRRIGLQNIEDQRDGRWASWSCTLGFNVMGIYPEGYGTDDINMVARSPCHRFLAAADDRGGVILYNFPSIVDRQKHYWYAGHSSFVENVKWIKAPMPSAKNPTGGPQLLCSAGGADRAIFQWKLVVDVEPPEAAAGGASGAAITAASPEPKRLTALSSPSFIEQRATLAEQSALIQQQEEELESLKRRLARHEAKRTASRAPLDPVAEPDAPAEAPSASHEAVS
uniref:EML-like second beta-propeller domain-containing protein n=1 Tax=Emiliania huxleyi TaxID=2903 RepID=A0A7S3RSA6_EMIHU